MQEIGVRVSPPRRPPTDLEGQREQPWKLCPHPRRSPWELPPATLRPALDNAFRNIAAQVNIPGFRRGKVPARIIEQRFGRAAVLEEALNEAVPVAYEEALAEHDVVALGQPDIVIDQDLTALGDDDAINFTAEVDVKPEVNLPDYQGIEVEVADREVTDADVEERSTSCGPGSPPSTRWSGPRPPATWSWSTSPAASTAKR